MMFWSRDSTQDGADVSWTCFTSNDNGSVYQCHGAEENRRYEAFGGYNWVGESG